MKTFVVAGGAGFIGSHVCKALLARGDKAICLDNLITGVEENISDFLPNNNFVFIERDITKDVPRIEGKVDGVFHFASPASPNAKSPKSYINHPLETLMVNSVGTKNLLDLALEKKARFIFASSSEVYGDPDVSPQTEDYFGNVNPNGIRSVYDEGKRFGESITLTYQRLHNLDVRVIRIFNTYGPMMQKDDGRVVSNFINQALAGVDITIYGDGQQTRSFCYINDLVDGFLLTMDRDDIGGQVINLGNDEEYNIKELADIIYKMTDSSSKIIHEDLPQDDPHQRRPDLTLARKLLGYSPKTKLADGLAKTIEYFKEVK